MPIKYYVIKISLLGCLGGLQLDNPVGYALALNWRYINWYSQWNCLSLSSVQRYISKYLQTNGEVLEHTRN